MLKLLIATGNKGKIKELRTLLAGLEVDLLTPGDIGLDLDVLEDGQNYEENAGKKARAYSQASGYVSLADDSGLEVDALGGAPGPTQTFSALSAAAAATAAGTMVPRAPTAARPRQRGWRPGRRCRDWR